MIGVNGPSCTPLMIETIGPMGGTVNFTVELQPALVSGDNYTIKRVIDIDPLGVWYNYGSEIISDLTMLESLSVSGVSGGGSSGGGGGGSSTNTYTANKEEMKSGYTQQLARGDKMSFSLDSENHSLEVKGIMGNIVNITLSSDPINFLILIGQEFKFDLDNNSVYDLLVRLNSIVSNKANLTIMEINESAVGDSETIDGEDGGIGEEGGDIDGEAGKGDGELTSIWKNWIIIIILLAVLVKLGSVAIGKQKKH